MRLFFVLSLVTLLSACGGEEEVPPDVYETRGMIRSLPDSEGGEVRILHEEIPEFRTMEGEVVGMESMSMGFPVGDLTLLEGVAVGDRVQFTFEVQWSGDGPPLRLTALEALTAGERLDFEGSGEDETPESEPHEDGVHEVGAHDGGVHSHEGDSTSP